MQIRYYVPFKSQSQADALKDKLLIIEGVAIDTSVNKNRWQVPKEDLRYVAETLKGAQLRVDHAESALMVVGKVVDAWLELDTDTDTDADSNTDAHRKAEAPSTAPESGSSPAQGSLSVPGLAQGSGGRVLFKAEVGDEKLIEKILRGYISHVSIQVDSEDVECSKCQRPSRREGMLVHLCPGAWEVVHKPVVRELSIVASPAYERTEFQPIGFFKAMNEGQWQAVLRRVMAMSSPTATPSPSSSPSPSPSPSPSSSSSEPEQETEASSSSHSSSPSPSHLSLSSPVKDGDVGARPSESQAPEQKLKAERERETESEVKPPMDAQKEASPQQAQAVVNVGPGESSPSPKPVEYEELMRQLEKLMPQIKGDEAKKLARKLSDLARRLKAIEAEAAKKGEEAEEAEEAEAEEAKRAEEAKKTGAEAGEAKSEPEPESEAEEAEEAKAKGKGIVAIEEAGAGKDILADYDWFKDLLKAHRRLVGFR